MRTIYKYKMELTEKQVVKMPMGGLFLDVQMQSGDICIWAEVDSEWQNGERTFWIVGTGKEIPEVEGHMMYRGSVQMGAFVWHIYEEQGAK